jgi:hypothetical protein
MYPRHLLVVSILALRIPTNTSISHVSHSIEDGTLYSTVRFKDKTDFSLRYACEMFVVRADICNVRTGDYDMIREYVRPIPREK